MVVEADVAVIGAGIAGVSVAAALTPAVSVVLLERESQPAYHTTGRSAAMFLESYGSPEVRELTVASRPEFEAAGTLLRARPLLWVAAPGRETGLAALRSGNAALHPVDPAEVGEVCPVLRPEWRVGALLEADSMEIDVLGLHQHFLGAARRRGLRVLPGAPVHGGGYADAGWSLDTGAGEVRAGVVVDAAGAWADEVAVSLGVAPVGLRPLLRTAAVARAGRVDPAWPLVSDVDEGFYFRPEAAGILLSPADETPSEPCDARADEVAVALAIERVNQATTLGLRSVHSAWAGLRTFAPDRNPVVGPDPEVPSFHWLAGQGGFGIQTAPALARLAAAAVAGGSVPGALSAARLR